VRIVAAEALCRFGGPEDRANAQGVLAELCDWQRADVFVAIAALNSVDACGETAAPLAGRLRNLPRQGPVPHQRYRDYVPRLLDGWK
jgi:hypothetical protein